MCVLGADGVVMGTKVSFSCWGGFSMHLKTKEMN